MRPACGSKHLQPHKRPLSLWWSGLPGVEPGRKATVPSRFGVCRTPVKTQRAEKSAAHGLRGRGVLGDGLGALGHGVLGELSGEGEAHGGLDLAGREGALLVVAHELAGLVGDLVKDV